MALKKGQMKPFVEAFIEMKIFLDEMSELPTELTFSQDQTWLLQAVQEVDEHFEHLEEASQDTSIKKRPILTSLEFRKVDQVVVLQGKIQTFVNLICSRCALFFPYPCQSKFSVLFCQDPVMAGIAHLERDPKNFRNSSQPRYGRPIAQNHGFARHAHDVHRDQEIERGKDLDINYLSENFIDLSEVIKEQVQLQVPFQPLCSEACQGICSQY